MNIRLPFDREGWKFSGIAAVIAVFLGCLSTNMGWLGFLITIGCLLFFRDPERVHTSSETAIISPADGVVLKVSECEPPEELSLEGTWKKVSIFMSVLNVHVNRAPVSGVVEKVLYIPGKFFNASLDKASEYNERQATFMRMADGTQIVFVQIAGLIARRIRCDVAEGQEVKLGDRVGLIRFGSRVDVYFSENAKMFVQDGQITVAGETILADLSK